MRTGVRCLAMTVLLAVLVWALMSYKNMPMSAVIGRVLILGHLLVLRKAAVHIEAQDSRHLGVRNLDCVLIVHAVCNSKAEKDYISQFNWTRMF